MVHHQRRIRQKISVRIASPRKMVPFSVATINGWTEVAAPEERVRIGDNSEGRLGHARRDFGTMKLPGRMPEPAASCPTTRPLSVLAMKNGCPGRNAIPQGFRKDAVYMVRESRHIHIGRQICLPVGEGLRRGAVCGEAESGQQ